MNRQAITLETPVKEILIAILGKEYPLSIVQLQRFIKQRYGRSVSYQGVRKISQELLAKGTVQEENGLYQLNKEWVKGMRDFYLELAAGIGEKKPTKVQSEEVSVYEFGTLKEMMSFWYSLINDWFEKSASKGDINCYQCSHAWEALLHLDDEHTFVTKLKEKKVNGYVLITSDSILDRSVKEFYRSHQVKCSIATSRSLFDKSLYVATYGALIIQAVLPKDLVIELEQFFKTAKKIDSYTLSRLSLITKKESSIKLTVIRNKEMAEQMNRSILQELT